MLEFFPYKKALNSVNYFLINISIKLQNNVYLFIKRLLGHKYRRVICNKQTNAQYMYRYAFLNITLFYLVHFHAVCFETM